MTSVTVPDKKKIPAQSLHKYYPSVSKVQHAGSFHVSIIHQTDMDYRIFNMRAHDHSHVCIRKCGLGTQTASQHNIFDLEKLSQFFVCAPDGV